MADFEIDVAVMEEFREWRDSVDQEHLLDAFDLALGWFSGRGYSHDAACDAATLLIETDEEEEDG